MLIFLTIIALIIGVIFLLGGFEGRLKGFSFIPFTLAGIFFILAMVRLVGPGEVGVQILFGRVKEEVLHSGLHLVNPLLTIEKMSIRTQEYTMSKKREEGLVRGDDAITALTKEGLSVDLDVTVWFHLQPETAWKVYRDIGEDYVKKIVRPAIRTSIRNVAATYSVNDIYSANRERVSKEIFDELVQNLKPRGIIVENVLLRNVSLPPKVKNAIDEKIAAEQEAQKMKYVLQKEEQEAKRKRIEAEGIARAQRIIANSLTNSYLQWYYIQTLKELINSPNNTVIIAPFDKNLTPLLQIPTGKK